MSDANIAILLEEGKAHWVDSSSMGLLPDQSLVREWRNIPLEHLEECRIVLLGRRKYTNPKTQTKTHTGLYRIQKVEDIVEKDKSGRIQYCALRETMAFGLATTLVGESARIVDGLDLPSTLANHPISPAHESGTAPVQQDYKTRTLKWYNLDPVALSAIVGERSALSSDGLVASGSTYAGTWYLLSRKPELAEDGSATYSETWGLQEYAFEVYSKKGDMEVTASRYIQGVPKNRVKAALDAEVALLGSAYGRAGFSYEQKLYWRNDQADIITESTETPGKTVTKTSETDKSKTVSRLIYRHANSLPDADAAVQGKKVQISGRITEDGDFDYDTETTTAVKQEVAQFDSEVSYAKTEKTKSGDNLYDADVAAYEITKTAGKILRRSHVKQDDGTFRDVVQEVVSISQTASIDSTHSDQHLDADNRTEDTERHTAAANPIADVAFSTQGTIVETENAPNEDGTYRTEQKTVVSKEQEVLNVVVSEDKFKQAKADLGKQIKDTNLAAHFAVAQTTGEIQTRRISENPDGTFDVQRDRDIARTVASAVTSSEIQAFETITRDVDKNNISGDTPPATQTAGTIVSVVNKVNEYDRVDVEVETRTAKAVTAAERETAAKAFDKSDAVTDRNQTATATPVTSQTPGTIVTAKGEMNEFGRYDNTVDTKTAVAVSTTEKITSATAFDTDEKITDRNQTSIATPITSQTAGTIKTARGEMNEYGRYDNTIETRTAVDKSTTFSSQSAALTTEETVTSRNAAAKEDASGGGSGTIVQVVSRLNEFGKYDNEKQTKTAVAASDTQSTESTALQTSSTVKKRNADSLEAGTGGGSGTIVRASGSKNEFGKYDTEKETITAVDATISAYAHSKDKQGTSTISIYSNSSSPPSLGSSFGECRYQKNAFGLYDGYLVINTYNASSSYTPRTGITEIDVEHRTKPSKNTEDQYRTITYTYNIGYSATQEGAYGFMTGGKNGSGVKQIEKDVWMYKKVTDVVATAWQDSSDGAFSA